MNRGPEYLLEALHVVKVFGTLRANDDVTLKVKPGEIHAFLGENGAGKSTLVKMIYGALQPTSGEFRWKGQPVTIASPAAARKLGIGMVFQHFSLFEALTVAENIALAMPGDFDMASAFREDRPRLEGVWPAARADRHGRRSLGRRAPAHRDRALPAAGAEAADHGRADGGADAAGGRPALRDADAARPRRLRRHLHQSSPGRGEAPLPQRHHPAPRQGCGECRSGARKLPRASPS